jgi:hypothetical protein
MHEGGRQRWQNRNASLTSPSTGSSSAGRELRAALLALANVSRERLTAFSG